MTPAQASTQYGAVASEWSMQRGELYPSGRRITLRDLMGMKKDETVASMFYGIKTTLAKVQWKHQACDNGVESTDPEAVKHAEYADSLLTDMRTSFPDYVASAVSYLLAGFSLSEVMFRQRNMAEGSRFTDNLWGVKSIIERKQLTVTGWVVNDGEVTGFKQMSLAGEKIIPLMKCMHLTNDGGPLEPQGESLFEAAYRPYQLKRRIQDSEAIGIERDLCGLPVMTMPQDDIDAATDRPDTPEGKKAQARVASAMSAVQDMRLNAAGGLVMPSDTHEDEDGKPSSIAKYDFKIVTSAGSRTIDTRGAIRDYDLMIMRIAMMQFLRLGDRAGGSYALSDTQSSLALGAMQAIVKKICFEWREKVLMALWMLNGMDPRWIPMMASSEITEDSLEVVGAFLESIASAHEVLAEDQELAEAMKGRLGFQRKKKAPDMEVPEKIVQPALPAPAEVE